VVGLNSPLEGRWRLRSHARGRYAAKQLEAPVGKLSAGSRVAMGGGGEWDRTSASYRHHAKVPGEEGSEKESANGNEAEDSYDNHDLGKPWQVEGFLVLLDKTRVRPRDATLRRLASQAGNVVLRKRPV